MVLQVNLKLFQSNGNPNAFPFQAPPNHANPNVALAPVDFEEIFEEIDNNSNFSLDSYGSQDADDDILEEDGMLFKYEVPNAQAPAINGVAVQAPTPPINGLAIQAPINGVAVQAPAPPINVVAVQPPAPPINGVAVQPSTLPSNGNPNAFPFQGPQNHANPNVALAPIDFEEIFEEIDNNSNFSLDSYGSQDADDDIMEEDEMLFEYEVPNAQGPAINGVAVQAPAPPINVVAVQPPALPNNGNLNAFPFQGPPNHANPNVALAPVDFEKIFEEIDNNSNFSLDSYGSQDADDDILEEDEMLFKYEVPNGPAPPINGVAVQASINGVTVQALAPPINVVAVQPPAPSINGVAVQPPALPNNGNPNAFPFQGPPNHANPNVALASLEFEELFEEIDN